MKAFLLTAICLMIACGGYTQVNLGNKTDTICVPVAQVQSSFRKDDSLRILKRENDSTRALVALQTRRLAGKDSSIIDLQAVIIKKNDEIGIMHGILDNTKRQRDEETANKNAYHNLYVQQRRSKGWIIVGFVALLGGIIALK